MTKNVILIEPRVVTSSQDKSGARFLSSLLWTIWSLDITKIWFYWEIQESSPQVKTSPEQDFYQVCYEQFGA